MTPTIPTVVIPRTVSGETTPLFNDYDHDGLVYPAPGFREQLISPRPPPFIPPPPICTLPAVRNCAVFEEIQPTPPPILDDVEERIASPIPLPFSPPTPVLIDLDERPTTSNSDVPTPASLQGLATPSESNGHSVSLVQSPPRIEPTGDQEWRELWPELTSVLRHLLQPASPPAPSAATNEPESMPGAMTVEEVMEHKETPASTQEYRSAVGDSPLAGEALLSRPAPAEMTERSRDFGHNLFEFLNHAAVPTIPIPPAPIPVPARHQASYVPDNNITDGQIFPPGAEFVKSWIMRNDGEAAWPEETTLRFVAGDKMSLTEDSALRVPVGCVLPGAEAELIGGEMKVCHSGVYECCL